MRTVSKTALAGGLYAIVDSAYVKTEEMAKVARAMVRGGAGVVQLRAKGLGAGDTLRAACAIRSVTAQAGAAFIINDRVDVAALCRADGVHLGQDDIPAKDARLILGPEAIIGVSTHNVKEALEAFANGADYVAFGPVFQTRTKGDADTTKGVEGFSEFREKVAGTVVAIGGVTEENLPGVIEAGADYVAIISDILLAPDPGGKVASVVRRIKAAKGGGLR